MQLPRFPLLFTLLLLILAAAPSWAAVGCDLNDPDRDVIRLFPTSTGYKTIFTSVDKVGGEQLFRRVESRLGDNFKGIYETIDVPYTLYEVFRGKEKIGYIHGVNQKGEYGGIQVFLVLDLNGTIQDLYLQKMTNRQGAKLRDESFTRQFQGLNLKDFSDYAPAEGKLPGRLGAIKNPAPEAEKDFRAILRGMKKNLILMDEFVYAGGLR